MLVNKLFIENRRQMQLLKNNNEQVHFNNLTASDFFC